MLDIPSATTRAEPSGGMYPRAGCCSPCASTTVIDIGPLHMGTAMGPGCIITMGPQPTAKRQARATHRTHLTRSYRTMKKRAEWNGIVLAESDDIVTVEGNAYFPAESLRSEHFAPSDTHTVCGWKGTASYHHVTVNGATNRDAA